MLRLLATDEESQERVRRAVKLGIEAWNLEWDGHVQAITGRREYWDGGDRRLLLRRPTIRLPQPT